MKTTDDTVNCRKLKLLTQLANEIDTGCQRRKLKVNVKKSKLMVIKMEKHNVIDFGHPHTEDRMCGAMEN